MLTFFAYHDGFQSYPHVLSALEALSTANNEAATPYDFWFKSMEISLSGRGKMGSLVGASDEVRRGGGADGSLNDYAVWP
jgi:cytokinesis protein